LKASSTNSSEEEGGPDIPNYEVFRTIGRGGYGEVWLAKSVTGAYRAIKVVRRSNFESDRAFEREFEGIQRYETVSQDHHGLVDILHVGRDDEQGFYYYVMELADDIKTGRDIQPDTYKPLTLSSKLKEGEKMALQDCLDVGCNLAEALGKLHAHKLTHRDVKPSNIIYIRDRPTLADPGLVALSGQNTFVGTEGYVPPEGPGKPQADLYSLGVVLYEMNTGKDRLDFPELPTIVDREEADFEERNTLNTIICNACAPRASQRYQSAAGLHEALSKVGKEPHKDRMWGMLPARLTAATAILFACGMFALIFRDPPHPNPVGPGPDINPPVASIPTESTSTDPENTITATTPTETPETNPKGTDVPPPDTQTTTPKEEDPEMANLTPTEVAPPETTPKETDPKPGEDKDPQQVAATDPVETPETDPDTKAEAANGMETNTATINPVPAEPEFGTLRITSFPPRAIVSIDGEEIGTTPLNLRDWPAKDYKILFQLANHRDVTREIAVKGGQSRRLNVDLSPWRPPVAGQTWENSLGMYFETIAQDGGHRSAYPLRAHEFEAFVDAGTYPDIQYVIGLDGWVFADGRSRYEFCQWMTDRDRDKGYLGNSLLYMQEVAEPLDGSPDLAAFYAVVDTPKTGSILIASEPSNADVFDPEGEKLGTTPLVIDDTDLGPVDFRLRKAGYGPVSLQGTVDHVSPLELTAVMEPNKSVIFGYPWQNSLDMKLMPVSGLLVAAWETRVQDFEAFWESEENPDRYYEPDFPQGKDHPVVNVNIDDAKRFCAWLTEVEREKELIQPNHVYRLPTDSEWSMFAGLKNEQGSTPEERDGGIKDIYPWGKEWPPPPDSGNFADRSALLALGEMIHDYDDGFVRTAPVGTFSPNRYGLYDIAGNVWEWVSDPYSADPGSDYVSMRGGSWQDHRKDMLQTSTRNVTGPHHRFIHWGFRVVLVDDNTMLAGGQ